MTLGLASVSSLALSEIPSTAQAEDPGIPVTVSPLALLVSVVPAGILDGTQSVCVGSDAAAVWTCLVTLDGADISSQVIGEIRIEAEEDAARIAELTLKPPVGGVFLPQWTGKIITIDVADAALGTPRWPIRLFTGLVDTPSVDMASGTLALRCTDDLQGRCDALTDDMLESLIGGYYSSAVFDRSARGWQKANDRLSTRAAALDISPLGALRVTPWAPKATADLVLTGAHLGEGSLTVHLVERSALTNEVSVAFDYRYPRIKAEAYRVEYELVNMTGFAQFILDERWFLQRAQVEAAIKAAGGTIETIAYTALPTNPVAVGEGYFTPSAADADLCMGFSALVSFDYTQTVTEQHALRVFNALSIEAVGLRRETMTGALEGEYPDLVAVESGILLFKAEISGTPPVDKAAVLEGNTTTALATLTPETDRNAANAAMEALIARAKTRIWASHRGNSVSATAPLMPALDLDKTVEIATQAIQAKGKLRRVAHRLSPETGLALSEFSVALCAIAGVGITHDETATAAPDGLAATPTALPGLPVITYNSAATADHVITITIPGVSDTDRSSAEEILNSEFAAPLVEDLFTVTLGVME